MRTIRIFFEYQSSFLWILDDGFLIDNVRVNSNGYFEGSGCPEKGIPLAQYPEDRLLGQKDLENKVDYLNRKYWELFINNKVEFSYKGFSNQAEKKAFLEILEDVIRQIDALLKDKYEIINEADEAYFDKDT